MILEHMYCLEEAIIDLSKIQSIEIVQKDIQRGIVIFFISGDMIISGEEAGKLLLEIEHRNYFGNKLSKAFQDIISATVPAETIAKYEEDEPF